MLRTLKVIFCVCRLTILLLFLSSASHACLRLVLPDVKDIKNLSYFCSDTSSFDMRLRRFKLGPKSVAVIGAISDYPNAKETLPPAAQDLRMLEDIFKRKDFEYDEIIVLEEKNFSIDNLKVVFGRYPPLMGEQVPLTVTFMFSGHGVQFDNEGYLIWPNAPKIAISSQLETDRGLSFADLRQILDPTISKSQYFLALINSCFSGHFLNRPPMYPAPGQKVAVGITAGDRGSLVWNYKNVGTGKGSAFFEIFIMALTTKSGIIKLGDDEIKISLDDEVLTNAELWNILFNAYTVIERYKPLRPQFGSLTTSSNGMFYFTLDENKRDKFFYANEFDKGQTPAGFGSNGPIAPRLVPEGSFWNFNERLLSAEGDWALVESGRQGRRYCVLESRGNDEYNRRSAALFDGVLIGTIQSYGDGKSTKLRYYIGQNAPVHGIYYSTVYNLRSVAKQSKFLNFRSIRLYREPEESQVELQEGGMQATGLTESQLRIASAIVIFSEQQLPSDEPPILRRLTVDGTAKLNSLARGYFSMYDIFRNVMKRRIDQVLTFDPFEFLLIASVLRDSVHQTDFLADLSPEDALIVSRLDVDESMAVLGEAFQQTNARIRSFQDEISAVGFSKLMDKSETVCPK